MGYRLSHHHIMWKNRGDLLDRHPGPSRREMAVNGRNEWLWDVVEALPDCQCSNRQGSRGGGECVVSHRLAAASRGTSSAEAAGKILVPAAGMNGRSGENRHALCRAYISLRWGRGTSVARSACCCSLPPVRLLCKLARQISPLLRGGPSAFPGSRDQANARASRVF